MPGKLRFNSRLSLLVPCLLASSALAECAVLTMTATSSHAATLASSQATLEFNNFSTNSLDIQTLTEANTSAIAESGSSTIANSQAEAYFIDELASSFNSSLSQAAGEGRNYLGLAESQTEVIGNFFVEAGQTFSFDFTANFDLNTSIDDPSFENANASGDLAFFLVDTHQPSNIYDYFVISGNLTTPGNDDFLNSQSSEHLVFNVNSSQTDFAGTQEFALTAVEGLLERDFEQPTSITLIQSTANSASVPVPESESTFGLLLFLGFMGARYRASKKLKLELNVPTKH